MKKRSRSKSFIRKPKDAMSVLPQTLINGGLRTAGAVGANIGSNHLRRMAPGVPAKLHGPGLFILGILGEAFLDNDYARSVSQGISTAGGLKMADEFTPEIVKNKIGMSGLGGIVIDSTPDWEKLTLQSGEGSPLQLDGFDEDEEIFDYASPTLSADMQRAEANLL